MRSLLIGLERLKRAGAEAHWEIRGENGYGDHPCFRSFVSIFSAPSVFPMPGAFEKSIRRVAVAVLMLAMAAPVFAEVPPPDPHSGLIGLIVYWIKLILHGEWGTLFGSVFFLVVLIVGIACASALLGWLVKPIERMIDREREKEKDRRLRLGIVTPPGGKSTFPINAVLLVRGIKAALGGSAEGPQVAGTAASAGSRNPWEAARKAVETDAPSSPVKSEIKASPSTAAPTARPTIATPSAGFPAAAPAEETKRPTQPPPAKPAKVPPAATVEAGPNEDAARPDWVDRRTVREPVQVPADAASKRSVFISYRREDSRHITGRIYDRLVQAFGDKQVFFDVDSGAYGIDFREHIRDKVGNCAVFLAIIGRNWNPPNASGQPRMNDARDHLRIEVESALQRGIPVIPVLVDGVEVPDEKDLPQSLANLAYRNAIMVRTDPDFHHDMDRLVRGIEQYLK